MAQERYSDFRPTLDALVECMYDMVSTLSTLSQLQSAIPVSVDTGYWREWDRTVGKVGEAWAALAELHLTVDRRQYTAPL